MYIEGGGIEGGTKFKMPQKYIPETLYFTQCSGKNVAHVKRKINEK